MQTLKEWINEKYKQGGQAAFARDFGIGTRGITEAINRGDIVVGGIQYSPRRVLEPKALEKQT